MKEISIPTHRPVLPKLIGAKSKSNKRSGPVKVVSTLSDASTSFTPSLPKIGKKKGIQKEIINKTLTYTYAPALPIHASLSFMEQKAAQFCPELLHKEERKEVISLLPDEHKRSLFANLNFPLEGTLMRREDGLYYLSISRELYSMLYDLFFQEGFVAPDYSPKTGPLIPVVLPHENPLGLIYQEGKSFSFSIKRAACHTHYDWPGVSHSVNLSLTAPELTTLRSSLGLSERILGRDFFLTLTVKRSFETNPEQGYFRVHGAIAPV